MLWRNAVLGYALLQAAAYCCLLPLWEGFDEAYHYAHVQWLSTHATIPNARQAVLSREVARSFDLVPVSHFIQPITQAPIDFSAYQQLPDSRRRTLRAELDSLPRALQSQPQPGRENYEASQAPLVYLLLAPLDRALSSLPLPTRVLWLRLLASLAALILLAHAGSRLASELAIDPGPPLFCLFSAQMLYATLCHVSNDTFAPAAMAYVLWTGLRAVQRDSARDWLFHGLALSCALLVKSYFLFVLPLPLLLWLLSAKRLSHAAALAAPLALLAAPWYLRNVVLYDNLSGALNSTTGLTPAAFLQALFDMRWSETLRALAFQGLWTGNNSFTVFSWKTLAVILLLLASGLALCLWRGPRSRAAFVLAAGIALFSVCLLTTSVVFAAGTHGLANAAMPWYTQVILLPILLLAFAGFRHARWLSAATMLVFAYLMAATYVVKLIPLYGGFGAGAARLDALWRWYRDSAPLRDSLLATVLPAPLWLAKSLVVLTILTGFALAVHLTARLRRVTME